MFPCCLIGNLSKLSDQFLEHIPHFHTGYVLRMQVDFLKAFQYQEQKVGLFQFGNLVVKLKLFNNFPGFFLKAVDIIAEVGGNVVGVGNKLIKVEQAAVMKIVARYLVQNWM